MLQLLLIALYHYVCRHFATHPALHFQRQSNNDCPNFTDQKRMTIHLFGLLKHRFSLRMTYDYILEHWADWFPQLPSYQAVNYPLNQFGWHFESGRDALSQHLQTRSDLLADVVSTDSVPIIRSPQPVWARVALGLTDKGYCATKKLFYQGLKWHMLATDRLGRLPLPQRLHLRAASVNDLSALRVPVVALESVALVGDKAYASAPFADQVAARQNVRLVTPLKKAKGQG